MGGKTFSARRMDASEHHQTAAMALEKLSSAYPGYRSGCIPSYFDKSSFGDVDLLVEASILDHPLGLDAACQSLADLVGADRWLMNGSTRGLEADRRVVSDQSVLSFALPRGDDHIQLDFLLVTPVIYDACLAFYSYNMLGNLISSQADVRGFSWGGAGLEWQSPGKKIAKVSVTRDPMAALEFIGYDASRFRRGFRTLEEVFQYATTAPGFDSRVYDLSQKPSSKRRRDAVRVNYMEFLKFLEQGQWPTPAPIDKAVELQRARQQFPDFAARMDEQLANRSENLRVEGLLSREFFSRATGLEGEEAKLVRRQFLEDLGGKQAASDLAATLSEQQWIERLRSVLPPPSPRPRLR